MALNSFLANAVRGKYLPIIRELICDQIKPIQKTLWAELSLKSFEYDPLKCILCGGRMLPSYIVEKLKPKQMVNYHKELATRQLILA